MGIKINPTASVTFALDGKDASVTFEVAFVAPDMFGDAGRAPGTQTPRFSAIARSVLIDAIQGWGWAEPFATAEGEPIPHTEEAKAKYLAPILGLIIKDENDQTKTLDKVLGRALLTFTMDADNFLKN